MNGHHIAAVLLMIIAGAQVGTNVQVLQHLPVRFIHRPAPGTPLAVPFIKAVDVFPVNLHRSGDVFRLFHASFDLKGINSAVNQLRKNRKNTHILHGNGVADTVSSGGKLLFIQNLIRQPAGPGAAPTVPAPSAKKAGHQTSPGIGVAHCSVNKALHLNFFLLQKADLLQRELSCRNHAHKALPFQKTHGFSSCHRHLRAGMQLHTGTAPSDGSRHSKILDDHAVKSLFCQTLHKGGQLGKLLLTRQCIHGKIDPDAEKMSFFKHLLQLLLCEISCISAGTELLSCKIHGIRSGIQRSPEGLHPARRSKKLHSLCIVFPRPH